MPPDPHPLPRPIGRPGAGRFGLLLALGGGALVAVTVALSRWGLSPWGLSTWTAQTISLPPLMAMAGLAAALARSGVIAFALAVLAWCIGLGVAASWPVPLMAVLAELPGAVTHGFLTVPISFLVLGAVLVVPDGIRRSAVAPAAIVIGVMYGLAARLGASRAQGDTEEVVVAAAVGLWAISTLWLLLKAGPEHWVGIGTRIFGSWLLAIGLLYGAVAMTPRRGPVAGATPGTTVPASAVPDAGFADFGPGAQRDSTSVFRQ